MRLATKTGIKLGLIGMACLLTAAISTADAPNREAWQTLQEAWRIARTLEDPYERAFALHYIADGLVRLERYEEARAVYYEALMVAINEKEVYKLAALVRALLTSPIVNQICPEMQTKVDHMDVETSPPGPFGVKEPADPVIIAAMQAARESLRRDPIQSGDACALLARFREPDWYAQGALSSPSLVLYRTPILVEAAERYLQRGEHAEAYNLLQRALCESISSRPEICTNIVYKFFKNGFYEAPYLKMCWIGRYLYYPTPLSDEESSYYQSMAEALISNKRYNEAYQAAMLIPESDPVLRAAILRWLAYSLARTNSSEKDCSAEVEPFLRQALRELLPYSEIYPPCLCSSRPPDYMDILWDQKRFLTAQDLLNSLRAVELDPPLNTPPDRLAQIHYLIGLALLELNQIEEAEPHLILALYDPTNYNYQSIISWLTRLPEDNPAAQRLRLIYASFAGAALEPQGGQVAIEQPAKPFTREDLYTMHQDQLINEAWILANSPTSWGSRRSRGEILGQLESLYVIALQWTPSPRRAKLLLNIAKAYNALGLKERVVICLDQGFPDVLRWKQENWEALLQSSTEIRPIGTMRQPGDCLPNPFVRWGGAAETALADYLLEAALLYAQADSPETARWLLLHAAELIFLWNWRYDATVWLCRLYQLSTQIEDEELTVQILRRAPSYNFFFVERPASYSDSETMKQMIHGLVERGDFERARLLIQRLAYMHPRHDTLLTMGEAHRNAGRLQDARALLAQAVDEAQGSGSASAAALWQNIGARLMRLDAATLRRQRAQTRHPMVRLGMDALLTRSPQHRTRLLAQARALESPMRRAWLCCLVGVGAHRGGDAKLAEQAFDEAVSAVNEIVYPDTRAHLTQLLEMARATCRSQGEPASQQNAAHPAGKPASSEDTPPRRPLKQLLSEGDYLTAFKVAWGGDSWEELPYSVTDFVAAQLARDPRRIILLPALLKRLSDYEIFAIARALIKAGDYGTALRLTLRMRNMDYRFEVVMRTALAQAQRGQKEIALATVELLDSLILRLEPHEFKLYKYLYRMYTRWGDTEQAALCLQKMQQIAYQTEYDEIIQINKIIEILILVHDYKALDELLEQHYAGMEVVIEIAARLLDEGSIEEATPLVEWIISKIYVDRIMPCDTKTAHVLVAALKTKRQREVLRILTRHSLTHRQCRIAEAVLRRCLDQADYDTARLVALHIPYDSSGSTSGSVRQNVLALLATRLIYEGDQDSWRPLYYELVQNGEAAKEWWNLYNALVGGGWYREAALLAGSSLPSAYSPLIEAGEYDLVLYFVAPPNPLGISCTLPRPPLRHLAREITLLQGRAAAKAYLKQLDSPVSQFLWLMGIFEADYPLLPPQPLEMRY